jgi:hypothetical protein
METWPGHGHGPEWRIGEENTQSVMVLDLHHSGEIVSIDQLKKMGIWVCPNPLDSDIKLDKAKSVNARDRGTEMLKIPMNELPPLAVSYAKFLCRKYGMCGEIMLTAWCHYAECVEGCKPSNDVAYQADDQAFNFFWENLLKTNKNETDTR